MTDDADSDFEDFDDLDAEEEEKNTKKGGSKDKPKGIGATAVANKLGVEPKTFRAWLRNNVASGKVAVKGHEFKGRYSWASWKDPELVALMKSWSEASHERGGARKGTGKKAATKTAAKPAAKTAAKKPAPKKRTPKA